MSTQDAIEQFALVARIFAKWVTDENETGAAAARRLLTITLDLYVCGLKLPSIIPDFTTQNGDEWDGERSMAVKSAAKIPLDFYGEVFNPLIVPPEEPCIGMVSDDIADIYRDVVTGLRLYDQGKRDAAVCEWKFGLQHHWGEHATGIIRALHCWLTRNYELR